MRAIINRYLAKEILQSLLSVTVVLLFILLSNQFARVLGDAASGDLPRDVVGSIIGLTSITYLTVLVPVGLFLAVMLALGRLYRDSEMSAIAACGVGPLSVYQPIAVVSVVLGLLLAWLSLYVSPWAAAKAEHIIDVSKQAAGLGALEPGRFRVGAGDGLVFYAERIDEDGVLQNVFLQRRKANQVEIAVAETGEIRNDQKDGERIIVLKRGKRYEGQPGTVNFRIMHFAEHGIPIFKSSVARFNPPDREALPTQQLLQNGSPQDMAEFHWRLSAPISAMILSLLAVPLARTNPRQGRYAKLAVGIATYLVYANLLGAAQVWLEQGRIPSIVGMWPVHAIVASIAVWMLWRHHHLPAPRR